MLIFVIIKKPQQQQQQQQQKINTDKFQSKSEGRKF